MGGLKDFFAKHRPDEFTADLVEAEIQRLEREAEDIEYHHWQSEPRLEGAKLLRQDAKALKSVLSRVVAGQSPIAQFEKSARWDVGAIVLDSGAIWQKTSDEGGTFSEPGRGGWRVLAGTPKPQTAPAAAAVDYDFHLFDLAKSKLPEESRAFLSKVEREAKKMAKASGLSPDQLKRPVTARYHIIQLAGIQVAVKQALNERDALIDDLKRRVEQLEAGGVKYCGTYQRALAYTKGSMVTEAGSAWVAIRGAAEGEKPGASDAWQLAVKAGRDGKDAR